MFRPGSPGFHPGPVDRLARVNTRKAWILYVVLRLAFFAVPFAALMLIGWPWWLSAITATLVGVSLSIIFLSKPRETAASSIHDWRHRGHTTDDIAEDAEISAGTEVRSTEGTSSEVEAAATGQSAGAGQTAEEETVEEAVTEHGIHPAEGDERTT